MFASIIWRAEFYTFFCQLYPDFMSMFFIVKFLVCQSKGKNLKSSTISQNESVFSIFKSMKSSCLLNDLASRS